MTTQDIIILLIAVAWIFLGWAFGRLCGVHWRALFFVAAVVLLPAAARAECLPSAAKVWAKHEGSHATWRLIDGRKCWMVGNRHAKEVMPLVSAQRTRTHDTRLRSAHPEHLSKEPAGAVRPLVTSPLYIEFITWCVARALPCILKREAER